jgi:TolA-binding protein
MELKELFGTEALTYEAFSKALSEKGIKLADLSTGDYVSKSKFDDELKSKDATITELNSQITTRDTDISNMKTKLENVDTDNKTKVADLTKQLGQLQATYDSAKSDYDAKLNKQSYEFAVKDFANSKKFTSNAAKRDFINEMLSENLNMKDGNILGAEDFVKSYSESNSDAFVIETPPEPTSEPEDKPQFVKPTVPTPAPTDDPFNGLFNFTGVRPHKE